MGLVKRATEETVKYINIANQKYGMNLRTPVIAFDLRGACAGQAWLQKHMIRYNISLLAKYGEEFITQTVAHEVAHLIAYVRNGYRKGKPHGQEWRAVMRAFGADASRCHSFDVTEARVVKADYIYSCKCKEWKFTAIRHRRAMESKRSGRGGYRCPECRETLIHGVRNDSPVLEPIEKESIGQIQENIKIVLDIH